MRQLELKLKQEKFRWKVFLIISPKQKEPLLVTGIEAYTEKQAIFLAGQLTNKSYDESSFAKKIGKV